MRISLVFPPFWFFCWGGWEAWCGRVLGAAVALSVAEVGWWNGCRSGPVSGEMPHDVAYYAGLVCSGHGPGAGHAQVASRSYSRLTFRTKVVALAVGRWFFVTGHQGLDLPLFQICRHVPLYRDGLDCGGGYLSSLSSRFRLPRFSEWVGRKGYRLFLGKKKFRTVCIFNHAVILLSLVHCFFWKRVPPCLCSGLATRCAEPSALRCFPTR